MSRAETVNSSKQRRKITQTIGSVQFSVYAIRISFNSRVIVQIVIFLMGISSVKWKLHKSLEIMYRFNANIVHCIVCVGAAALISRTSQWANNSDLLENCFNFTRASIIGNFSAASYGWVCYVYLYGCD